MTSNIKALPEKNMGGAPENRDMPLSLLDLSDVAVKELIRSVKKRGHVTVNEINSALPAKEAKANSEQIKETWPYESYGLPEPRLSAGPSSRGIVRTPGLACGVATAMTRNLVGALK
jgi:hypothetical protein